MSLHIEAQDFRSYPKIDWYLPSGLTLVDGFNAQTNGSNASGKSTLFDAWFWARYGWLPKWEGPKGGSADAIVRRKEGQSIKKVVVKVTETFGKDKIVIQRERPNKLFVWKNDEEIKGIDQNGLDQLLGMSASRFLVSVYLHQRRNSSFYWMSDNERTELLSVVSNLEQLDKCHETARAQKEESQLMIKQLEGSLLILNERLPKLQTQIENYQKQREESQAILKTANQELAKAQENLKYYGELYKCEYDSHLQNARIQLNDHLSEGALEITDLNVQIKQLTDSLTQFPSPEQELYDKVNLWAQKVNEDKAYEANRLSIIRSNESIRAKVHQLDELATKALEGSCDSCQQILPELHREEHFKKYKKQAGMEAAKLRDEPAAINPQIAIDAYNKAIQALEKRKVELEFLPAQTQKDIRILKSQIDQKVMHQKSLEAKYDRFVKDQTAILNEKHTALRKEVESKQDRIKSLDYRFQMESQNHKSSVYELEEVTKKIKSTEEELTKWKFKFDEALDLIDIFGIKGFRAICFDGLVERISEKASELLGIMTSNLYSTKLEQLKYDTKGNQKLILKPVLFKNGVEVPQDDLSGGMESRVSLVYDISLSMAIGEELPLLLDEALEGLDAVGKEEAMVLLEQISKTRSVLVIDHSSEFKAIFNQVIRVVYQDEESRLEFVD